MYVFFSVVCIITCILVKSEVNPLPGSDIQIPKGNILLKTGKFRGKLYSVDSPTSVYSDSPLILDLHGSSFEQGFDAGFLLG